MTTNEVEARVNVWRVFAIILTAEALYKRLLVYELQAKHLFYFLHSDSFVMPSETVTVLRFVKLTQNALSPVKGSVKAAGFDLRRYTDYFNLYIDGYTFI
jgi:hypothetical protein